MIDHVVLLYIVRDSTVSLPTVFVITVLFGHFLCVAVVLSEAYSFTADGYGIFSLRMQLGACCRRQRGSSLYKLTRRERACVVLCVCV